MVLAIIPYIINAVVGCAKKKKKISYLTEKFQEKLFGWSSKNTVSPARTDGLQLITNVEAALKILL